MTKNTHRLRHATSLRERAPRYLFDLSTSEGLTTAQCMAISAGIQAAFEEKQQGLALSSEARESGAITMALKYEQVKLQGKRGTNDAPLYRSTFSKLATRMHEAMLSYMETEPQIFLHLSHMTPEQRNRQALITAEKYVAQIVAIPEDQPITMTWF